MLNNTAFYRGVPFAIRIYLRLVTRVKYFVLLHETAKYVDHLFMGIKSAWRPIGNHYDLSNRRIIDYLD